MFGYITPYKEELKIREYDVFKAYYCGLCKSLGHEFNQIVRFGLNYDLAFLALLLSSIDDNKDSIKSETCIANPIKKKPIIQSNRYIEYSSYISVILIYFKLLDDWKDDKSIKSILATIPYIVPVKKAKRVYKDKYNVIRLYLEELSKLEDEENPIVDSSSHVFGKLMEEIATPSFIEDNNLKRILGWLGYNMGRWIYIIDAFSDIEEDVKSGNYNPILLQYKYSNIESTNDFINRVKESVEFSLTLTLDNIAKSFELISIKRNKSILDNIIYMGTRHRMDQIFRKGVVECEESI